MSSKSVVKKHKKGDVLIDQVHFTRAQDARVLNAGGTLFYGYVAFYAIVFGVLAGGKDLVIQLKNATLRRNANGDNVIVPGKRTFGGPTADVDAIKHQLDELEAALAAGDGMAIAAPVIAMRKILEDDTSKVQRKAVWWVDGETKALIEAALYSEYAINDAVQNALELEELAQEKDEEVPS
jgi:hypothetical protein